MNTHTISKPAGAILTGILALAALGVFGWSNQLQGVPQFVAVLGAIALGLAAFCAARRKDDLVHDFFLPVLLFAALGGFTWAVRGSSGFGAVKGCVFAGVMWGAAWWFIARNPGGPPIRRYASGWIVLALTIGIGLSGARGWMQWSSFFEGKLQTNTGAGEFVEIDPTYGFIWLFIAGVPWAGIGACMLAWCAAERPLAAWKWGVRLFCGFGMAYFLDQLYQQHPQWFLPLYSSIQERYQDLDANPNLRRLMNDNGNAIRHLGFYLGFLLFEIGRRDWRNVTLISTVGLLNGAGWALCQNWKWAPGVFGDAGFNWWRCWESCGGISIGVALGVAYYLVNRPMPAPAPLPAASAPRRTDFYFGAFSAFLMAVLLVWFLVERGGQMFGSEWRDHLDTIAFAAVLLAGAALYAHHLWRVRRAEGGGEPSPVPPLSNWLPRYGLFVLIVWFLSTRMRLGRGDNPLPWWARFDLYLLVIAAGYGAVYVALYMLRAMARNVHGKKPRVSVFLRYPNPDWLAVYLLLLAIGAAFLQGELPAWKGWLWMAAEEPARWYVLLGPAVLAGFGVAAFVFAIMPWGETISLEETEPHREEPNLERLGVYLGLLVGLGMSLKNGTRGWANIYLQELGSEQYWGDIYWRYIGPGMLAVLAAIVLLVLLRRVPAQSARDPFPHAALLVALVLVVQNILGQAITGPITNWNEMAFNLYYVLLFLISAVILYHYHDRKRWQAALATATPAARIEGSGDAAMAVSEGGAQDAHIVAYAEPESGDPSGSRDGGDGGERGAEAPYGTFDADPLQPDSAESIDETELEDAESETDDYEEIPSPDEDRVEASVTAGEADPDAEGWTPEAPLDESGENEARHPDPPAVELVGQDTPEQAGIETPEAESTPEGDPQPDPEKPSGY
ncbi:MAG: hypothetical protein KF886_08385 [Candidatus Hydrogenedentes bacterium]|nr:hypothetical protein [Candidatus Hydrogenedentota bacterium]